MKKKEQQEKRPMMENQRFVLPTRRNIGKSAHASNLACRRCGRYHGNGPCSSVTGACFEYGGMGHHIRNCLNLQVRLPPSSQTPRIGNPTSAASPVNSNRPPAQGRVYTLAWGEIDKAPSVITSMVSLHNYVAFVSLIWGHFTCLCLLDLLNWLDWKSFYWKCKCVWLYNWGIRYARH